MASKRVNVVWFKCTDLRTHDHAALKAAHDDGLPVLHIYVFDPFWHANTTRLCGFPKTGAIRTRFQIEAIEDLRSRLAAVGHVLNVRTGISTAACFKELCQDYTINAVFAFNEICSEELKVERQVREVLQKNRQGQLRLFWGFELYHREDLRFDPARTRINSYTAFRKRVEEGSHVRATAQESPKFRRGADVAVSWQRADEKLPSVKEAMGATYDPAADPGEELDPRAELRWTGGETAALARVKQYLWDDSSLGLEYVGATMTMDPAKSCMREKAMSKLSPFLAHGCLSPRLLYEEVKRYERERSKSKSTYWLIHELVWRDFVRFGSIYYGTSIFKIGGIANTHPTWKWSTDKRLLKAWIDGLTGFPFIDCFMRELKVTGYCNHMGRECSGWFVIGDLGMDWRLAAEWFESVLIDYEPTANWFNWTYRCLPAAQRGGAHGFLVENPGHRLQGLEILKWGAQHDPDATWIKRWIPELAHLRGTTAREPWRLGLLDGDGHDAGKDAGKDAGNESRNGLRPPPKGKFDVKRGPLESLAAMGFAQKDAAVALYRTWEDADMAAALLVSGEDLYGGDADESGDDADLAKALALSLKASDTGGNQDPIVVDEEDEEGEDSDLALAIQMSMGAGDSAARSSSSPAQAKADTPRDSKPETFRYGIDYPKPVIQPVSMRNTEQLEDEARRAQSDRDRQITTAKQRRLSHDSGGYSGNGRFDKQRWEESKQRWPAETPTSAGKRKGQSKGKGEAKGRAEEEEEEDTAGQQASGASSKGQGARSDRKRRWGGKDAAAA